MLSWWDGLGDSKDAPQIIRFSDRLVGAYVLRGVTMISQIMFPMQKLAIFCKVKEIKELCGGIQVVRRTSNSAD